MDLDTSRVLFVTEGKDASTVERFKQDMLDHGGNPEAIKEICADMSPAFISGVAKCFPGASLTFDKFHVVKIVNGGLETVRREEAKSRPELKGSRFVWLKNPASLKPSQATQLEKLTIRRLNLKTSRAYHIKFNFQALYQQTSELAEAYLKKWYYWATHSRLAPMIDVAHTIKRHWDGILRWFKSGMSNGILEGTNSRIQAVKSRARGYRSIKNLSTMIYLIAGKLNFDLPT